MGGFANNAPIVTDGLVFYVDAGNDNSYPGSGTTWTDLVGSNDGTFEPAAGPVYDSANGGSIVLAGADDYVDYSDGSLLYPWSYSSLAITVTAWVKLNAQGNYGSIVGSDYINNGTRLTIPFFIDIGDGSSNFLRIGHYGAGITYPHKFFTTSQFSNGNWYYIAVSSEWTATTTCILKAYKNGSEITSSYTGISSGVGAYNVTSNY